MPSGLKRFQKAESLHFITFSCFHRLPLLEMAGARETVEAVLEQTRARHHARVYAYVLMPEHVHLLVNEPPRILLAQFLKAVKQMTARKLRGPREKFWQDRYYDSNVYGEQDRSEIIRYIHRNPVKRGLVAKPEDCHPTDEDLSVGTPVAVVQLPALRDGRCGHGRDRVAVDGGAARQPVTRRGSRKGGRAFVLSHPSSKRRCLDGAQTIAEGPGVRNLAGLPARAEPSGRSTPVSCSSRPRERMRTNEEGRGTRLDV